MRLCGRSATGRAFESRLGQHCFSRALGQPVASALRAFGRPKHAERGVEKSQSNSDTSAGVALSSAVWLREPEEGRRTAGLQDSTLHAVLGICVSKIRRGNYVFLTWSGDHLPRHVHVYKDRDAGGEAESGRLGGDGGRRPRSA